LLATSIARARPAAVAENVFQFVAEAMTPNSVAGYCQLISNLISFGRASYALN
jgi:hypothetical protein